MFNSSIFHVSADVFTRNYIHFSEHLLIHFIEFHNSFNRYGLLGASVCVKTTLLSCLLGRPRLNSGDILVLRYEPGSPESGIPAPCVGYMPQVLVNIQ